MSSAVVPTEQNRLRIALRRGFLRGPLGCPAGQGLPDVPLGGHRGTRGVLILGCRITAILGAMKFPVRVHKCFR